MKKSTLLSFATAAAIVVTSAGTYAAWDTTTASNTTGVEVTIDKAVTMDLPAFTFTAPAERATLIKDSDPLTSLAQTTNASVTVNNVTAEMAKKYKIQYSVAVYDDAAYTNLISSDVVASSVDNATPGATTLLKDNNSYTTEVTITPASVAASGKKYFVKVTAELVDIVI